MIHDWHSIPTLARVVNCGAGWSGRWESNPPHQLGRLAHYHYATPASNAPPSYTSSRLTVKSKPGPLRHAARRHDRVGHTVDNFLIGGARAGPIPPRRSLFSPPRGIRGEPP